MTISLSLSRLKLLLKCHQPAACSAMFFFFLYLHIEVLIAVAAAGLKGLGSHRVNLKELLFIALPISVHQIPYPVQSHKKLQHRFAAPFGVLVLKRTSVC